MFIIPPSIICWLIIALLIIAGIAYLLGEKKLGDTALDLIRYIIIIVLLIILVMLLLIFFGPINLSRLLEGLYVWFS